MNYKKSPWPQGKNQLHLDQTQSFAFLQTRIICIITSFLYFEELKNSSKTIKGAEILEEWARQNTQQSFYAHFKVFHNVS